MCFQHCIQFAMALLLLAIIIQIRILNMSGICGCVSKGSRVGFVLLSAPVMHVSIRSMSLISVLPSSLTFPLSLVFSLAFYTIDLSCKEKYEPCFGTHLERLKNHLGHHSQKPESIWTAAHLLPPVLQEGQRGQRFLKRLFCKNFEQICYPGWQIHGWS